MGVSLREKRRMLSPRAIHLRIARPARRALGRRGSGTRGTMHTVDFRFAEDFIIYRIVTFSFHKLHNTDVKNK